MTTLHKKIASDYQEFGVHGLPKPLEEYILNRYGISLLSEYAGQPIRNPFGKASGQLSLTSKQIEHDATAGLGFAVLKTVIAEDESGGQSMKAWAIPATRMTVERIIGTRPDVLGEMGYTVTWKGRGWSGSLESYLDLFRDSLAGCESTDGSIPMRVVPSAKFHLPRPDEHKIGGSNTWRTGEYKFTIQRLLDVWREFNSGPMPLEKDFSPTLAGDQSFTKTREQIFEWLAKVPEIVRSYFSTDELRLGLKLFNTVESHIHERDDFQLEMLNRCSAAHSARADYLVYGNRLFDPKKEYEGTTGVAFGGPDLSSRNLSILKRRHPALPLSATGNILTGRDAFEYLKLGASSFQMHTLFQLPDSEFDTFSQSDRRFSRSERALHRLLFHPMHGFLAELVAEQHRRTKTGHLWPPGISISEIAASYAETIAGISEA